MIQSSPSGLEPQARHPERTPSHLVAGTNSEYVFGSRRQPLHAAFAGTALRDHGPPGVTSAQASQALVPRHRRVEGTSGAPAVHRLAEPICGDVRRELPVRHPNATAIPGIIICGSIHELGIESKQCRSTRNGIGIGIVRWCPCGSTGPRFTRLMRGARERNHPRAGCFRHFDAVSRDPTAVVPSGCPSDQHGGVQA